jgi:hypothetical protein
LAWLGLAWLGLAWLGLAWLGLALGINLLVCGFGHSASFSIEVKKNIEIYLYYFWRSSIPALM